MAKRGGQGRGGRASGIRKLAYAASSNRMTTINYKVDTVGTRNATWHGTLGRRVSAPHAIKYNKTRKENTIAVTGQRT